MLDREGDVFVLDLGDGPNMFDEGFVTDIEAALDEVEAAGPAGLVTTGTGKYFSNGFDLEFLVGLQEADRAQFVDRTRRLLSRVLTLGVPTAAAVNGHAFGVAAMFVLAHDLSVMRDDRGWWCLPEVDLGLRFHPFMVALLADHLRAAVVNEAMTTGRRYTGPEAVAAGIIGEVAAATALRATAIERVATRVGKDPAMLKTIKQDLYSGITASLQR